ncbi:Monoglyceride lipase [Geodia barretti]|uniref:Monoglyceride lipase n=1 Tax=Geodia barretti TaxID=519541 RepID=A0AA35WEW3_GEOBA|nr:Monoglyceride lipase [Geodia barretti]
MENEQKLSPADTQTSSLRSVWRGLKLHPTVWKPTGDPKALLCVCHGVGEYMGRYDELGCHLTHSGVLVFGHDHVGNGQSEGDRVHVEDIDTYVQDVIAHIELMRKRYPALPCILLGHSMGGLVAAHVAIQRHDLFTALILSAAAAELEGTFSYWIVVERYANDPLVWHGPWKAGWGAAMMESITLLRENAARISLPLLLMHGSEDNLVPITASHFINDNATSQEKKFEVFEGSHHETLHDKEQERARELIKEWVLSHLTAAQVTEPHSQSDSSAETETARQQAQEEIVKGSKQPGSAENTSVTDSL